MANVQRQFEKFHSVIRTDYEMSLTLREKRDIIVERVKHHQRVKGLPGLDKLDQGSYRMKTGVVPTEGMEFDIDVGLRFDLSADEYDSKTVRGWVFEAVKDHTNDVQDRGPCVRVAYVGDYHVDLVSYAWWDDDGGVERFRLAHKDGRWRDANPPKLLDHVDAARQPFDGTEDGETKTDQFRRCIRYLRRWYDVQVPGESTAKPVGIAYVLYAIQNLKPTRSWDGKPDDLSALEALSRTASGTAGRLVAKKPTPEYDDVFIKLTDNEMNDLKARFGTLADTLRHAANEPDPVRACRILRDDAFGPDFPVPPTDETGKPTPGPAIITTSSSA